MALHSLYCADVPWRNCSLTHSPWRLPRHRRFAPAHSTFLNVLLKL